MSYRQYTRCVQAEKHSALWQYVTPGLGLAFAGFISLLLGAWIAAPAIWYGYLITLVAGCTWWLYDRLVCLGGERCAVGLLMSVHPPENKLSGGILNTIGGLLGFLDAFDQDFGINLLLLPNRPGSSQKTVESEPVQGYLVKDQSVATKGLKFGGNFVDDPAGPSTAILHCEFEGGSILKLLNAARAALGLTGAATVACFVPIVGPFICALLAAIALAVLLAGVLAAMNDRGDPTHVNPALKSGELVPYMPGKNTKADVLLVKGEWVYDDGHYDPPLFVLPGTGWNEIHPIRHCQKIGTYHNLGFDRGGLMPEFVFRPFYDKWCSMIGNAGDAATKSNQERPEHQWTIHPLVDGCRPKPDVIS